MFVPYFRAYLLYLGFSCRLFILFRYRSLVYMSSCELQESSTLFYFCLPKSKFDLDKNGHITASEIGNVMKALGEDIPGYKLRDIVKEVDADRNGTVQFNEFLEVSRDFSFSKLIFLESEAEMCVCIKL